MFKRQNVFVMLCLLLVVVVMGTTFVSAAEATSHWSQEYITWAYGKGLTYSESNTGFRPEDPVTNAEFYKMVNRLAGYTEKAPISYRDVYYGNWYYDDVAIAVKAGYLRDSKEALNPNAFITRDEAARIIAYVYGLSPEYSAVNRFSDAGLIANKGEVGALVSKAILNGYPNGTFQPQSSIKRGEVAKILYFSNAVMGSPRTYVEKSTAPYYHKSCKYYGATSAELEALRVAIEKGKTKLAESSYIGTASQIAELNAAVADGQSVYNNAKSYNGYYYPNGYYYGYEYGRFASIEGVRSALVAAGFSYERANAIANNNEFVSYDGSGYYLNSNFYSSYGYNGYNGYPYYGKAYYGSFDSFYNDYKAYFNYDRDLAYKAWTNGYYGYGCYDGYWYNYGSEAVRAATRRIEKAIYALTPVTPPATPAEKVTVSFEAGEGSGTTTQQKVEKGKEFELPACTFTAPTGKEFKAWKVAGVEKAVGDKITVSADTTITALWEAKAEQVTVTLVPDNGTEATVTEQVAKDSTYTLPKADKFTAPTGKEFKAWKVGEEEKAAGTSITVSADTTITAVWTVGAVAYDSFTITFDANGGKGTMEAVELPIDTIYPLPNCDFTPPTGKEFKAWEVGGAEKAVGDEIKVDSNITVTAVWKDKAPEYDVNVTAVLLKAGQRAPMGEVEKRETVAVGKKKAGDTVTIDVPTYDKYALRTTNWSPMEPEHNNDPTKIIFTMPAGNISIELIYEHQ